ncbi:MAG: PEGA domain-containing protein [Planctomycetota bacterium]
MRKSVVCTFLAMLIFTQGCCSIFTSEPQSVSVDSKPPGAKVKIGPYEGKTPYTVSIPRGKDYIITASYQGKNDTVNLNKSIEPVYWVNILFWPGLIIDVATGKMFRYEPTHYDFDFTD